MDADTHMLTSALAMLDEPPTNLKEMLTRSVILAARRKAAMTKADLSVIPDTVVRWRADADFQIAQECRRNARRLVRVRGPGWRFIHRLELRRAIRFWQHYKAAVRQYHG